MQWLAALCVRRPVFATVLVLLITVVGAFGYTQLGIDRFPKIEFPTIVITTRQPGAAPEQVETEISDKIEEAVNTISGLDELRSTSAEGVSIVSATFLLEKNGDVAAQEVRDKVNRVLPQLPRNIFQPTIERMDTDAAPVLGIALSAPRPVRGDHRVRRQGTAAPPRNGERRRPGAPARRPQAADQHLARRAAAARLQPHGQRRVAGAAGAEHRSARRPHRTGAGDADAAHARTCRSRSRSSADRRPRARRASHHRQRRGACRRRHGRAGHAGQHRRLADGHPEHPAAVRHERRAGRRRRQGASRRTLDGVPARVPDPHRPRPVRVHRGVDPGGAGAPGRRRAPGGAGRARCS